MERMASEGAEEQAQTPKKRQRFARTKRTLAIFGGLLAILALVVTASGWRAFGSAAEGDRRVAMEASPQWADGVFENPDPLWNDWRGMLTGVFRRSDFTAPADPLPVVEPEPASFEEPPPSGLRVTWLGHSTLLIELDGQVFLTDPVWGEKSSPLTWLGPSRWYPPPIALADLPAIDAVLISHDHYDHLDYATIEAIADWDTTFVVPLGVGAHLVYWGVPEDRIVTLDWWDRHAMSETVELVAVPSRHASGRQVFDQNATLWAGYALIGTSHKVYFSGDTGLFDGMREIGERLGPFDVTMIEVGAYDRAWPDWHLGPENAVLAHQWVKGEVMIPVHWGLFDLANHGWTEPIERAAVAARAAEVTLLTPRPGQSVEPVITRVLDPWWPEVPWQTAEEHPIETTRVTR